VRYKDTKYVLGNIFVHKIKNIVVSQFPVEDIRLSENASLTRMETLIQEYIYHKITHPATDQRTQVLLREHRRRPRHRRPAHPYCHRIP